MSPNPTLLLGTTKGAFLLIADGEGWQVSGPHCDGWPINHVVGDPETGRIWAGGGGDWHGAGVWRSDDSGGTWTLCKLSRGQVDDWAAGDPEMAAMLGWQPVDTPFDGELTSVWSLAHAHGTLLAGSLPAGLFSSRDGGAIWDRVPGLNDHPTRGEWAPGAAGLVLHSIVPHPDDPARAWVGISAAGVFATEDAGTTWDRRNRLDNAEGCAHHPHPAAPRDGMTGFCVHNMLRAPGAAGDLLYQQNHHGVFRSRDGGRNWQDVTAGLPSTFGFPISVHPRDPATIWVVPLNGDIHGRYPPQASAAVWKSTDGGESWQARRDGLPARNCFFTVLRQAMATDRRDPAGVYFGTNTGSVFASHDEGETWDEIARHLPLILSVEVLDSAG